MEGVTRQRSMSMCALPTLSAALYEAVPVRVVGWCSGARCAAHGDGLFMSEDDSMRPVQDVDASALLSEALWARLDAEWVCTFSFSSMLPGAWSVSCADWRSFVLIVGVPCLLCSLMVPGVWGFLRVRRRR